MSASPRYITLVALAWLGSCVCVASGTIAWWVCSGVSLQSTVTATTVLTGVACFAVPMAIVPLRRKLHAAKLAEVAERIRSAVCDLAAEGHECCASTHTGGTIQLRIRSHCDYTTILRHEGCHCMGVGRVYTLRQHCVTKYLYFPPRHQSSSHHDERWMQQSVTVRELEGLLHELLKSSPVPAMS